MRLPSAPKVPRRTPRQQLLFARRSGCRHWQTHRRPCAPWAYAVRCMVCGAIFRGGHRPLWDSRQGGWVEVDV